AGRAIDDDELSADDFADPFGDGKSGRRLVEGVARLEHPVDLVHEHRVSFGRFVKGRRELTRDGLARTVIQELGHFVGGKTTEREERAFSYDGLDGIAHV